MSMEARYAVAIPSETLLKVEITMTAGEWRELRKELGAGSTTVPCPRATQAFQRLLRHIVDTFDAATSSRWLSTPYHSDEETQP